MFKARQTCHLTVVHGQKARHSMAELVLCYRFQKTAHQGVGRATFLSGGLGMTLLLIVLKLLIEFRSICHKMEVLLFLIVSGVWHFQLLKGHNDSLVHGPLYPSLKPIMARRVRHMLRNAYLFFYLTFCLCPSFLPHSGRRFCFLLF